VVQRALENYINTETWQVAEVKKALSEADAGDFATKAQVEEVFTRWKA